MIGAWASQDVETILITGVVAAAVIVIAFWLMRTPHP